MFVFVPQKKRQRFFFGITLTPVGVQRQFLHFVQVLLLSKNIYFHISVKITNLLFNIDSIKMLTNMSSNTYKKF